MPLKALLFDLGDVIMDEVTEEKIDGVTQRASLHPGMADLLRHWQVRGMPIGLVADTRDGTFRNVLGMHDLYDLFDVFSISDHLGVEKPDPKMFLHALHELRIPELDWGDVVMVGNNLARDIRGAKAIGLRTVWLVWNYRYPCEPADDEEQPDYQVGSADELNRLLNALHEGHDPAAWSYPQPFAWANSGT